jgi:small-conductance mechanosensitive channel
VHFYEFGDFSLKFEVVYYVSVGDYVKYMDTQQAINFAIKEPLRKRA